MSRPSWHEIQDRAAEFAARWAGETYEKGESQTFWSEFLSIFGIDRRRHGAFFEYAIKKGSGKQGFIDLFWPGRLLAEQKSAGKDTEKTRLQAFEYLETMPDHDLPRMIVVSDFATFELIDLTTTPYGAFAFPLADLPTHVRRFGFLIDERSEGYAEEDPVNRTAAENMAKLHNQLEAARYTGRDLELLLVRLVFPEEAVCLGCRAGGTVVRALSSPHGVTGDGTEPLGSRWQGLGQGPVGWRMGLPSWRGNRLAQGENHTPADGAGRRMLKAAG